MTVHEEPLCADLRASETGRLVRGGKLHATVYVGQGAPGVYVLACDARREVPVDLRFDYRYREWGHCRKKGCREFFDAQLQPGFA